MLWVHRPVTAPFVLTSPWMRPSLTNVNQPWRPSATCPRRLLINRYSNNNLASGLSICLRTASSILGRLPSNASGSHPIFIKRSAIWSRLLGLNGIVLVLLPVFAALSARTCFNLFSFRTSLRPPLVAAV
uniref:DNA polymerase n=1 Tax=uncultured marine virus TaxID=186617 RepID=A0A0F7L5U0_9VIRU|nr:DNA polymerase [uncultured marine virus]